MNELIRHLLSSVSNPLFRSRAAQTLTSKVAVTRADHDSLATEVYRFGESETLIFENPVAVDPLPRELRQKIGETTLSRPFVSEFRDAILVGSQALTLTSHGPLLENTLGSPRQLTLTLVSSLVEGEYPLRHRIPAETEELAVALVGPWMDEYYHWFSDYLLRVEGLLHYQEATGLEPTVIIPADPPGWLRRSLEHVGISQSRWRLWGGSRLRVDRLVVPSLRRETHLTGDRTGNVFSPQAYRWLAERIRTSVGAKRTAEERRIFISRERTDSRRVINREEVLDFLQDRGFEKYVLEELSLDEQVELFTDADWIVGPNGAGFVNMMYATDATVVPFYGPYVNACYPVMAAGLGFEHGFLLCETQGLDMRVDVSKLDRLLDRF